jgi:solute:Na+ symporter, SSS family
LISIVAACTPTRAGFDGPDTLRATMLPAESINTHSVFVPPPSNPRTYSIEKAYVKNARLEWILRGHGYENIVFAPSDSLTGRLAVTILIALFRSVPHARRKSRSMRIHPLDLGIVIAYLLGVTALGIRFRRGQKDARDYFLGGRTAPWWALAFSIVATETSTLTIIGTPAISYGGNLTFLQLVFGYLIGRILIVLLLLPGYFRGEFFTAYALIEKCFGERMRAVAASTFLITRAIAEGVRVSAIALVVSVVLGTSEKLAVVLVIALTVLYTFEGGMKAVIWTDVAQLLLYLTGSAVTFFVLLHRVPGGWAEVTQVAAAAGNKLQVFDFTWNLATKYTFWSGLIGGAFLTMASHGTDQTIVQRLLAARNERDSRAALLTSGGIVLIQFTVFLLIGVLLFVFAQHTPLLSPGERPDRILPLFIVQEMPTGLAGLMIAAIVAVAMSNASGSLNSLAASSVLDFSRLGGRSTDPAQFLRLSRRMTLFWGLVLMGFGLVKWGPLLETGLTVASLPFGSLLGLFLLGTLDRHANARGALIGMFTGLAAILCVFRFTSVAFTWYVLIGACVTFVVGALVSRITPPDKLAA